MVMVDVPPKGLEILTLFLDGEDARREMWMRSRFSRTLIYYCVNNVLLLCVVGELLCSTQLVVVCLLGRKTIGSTTPE